ncbi:MAG: CDP-alcohol phosphatidyltransferase family protein [Paludibacteraceae bacterium]|nr:CDP-alcohol phosphatidyltransferase family protein [Paludibacteraceae bacterium]
MQKHFPNILSLSRIPLSLLLWPLVDSPVCFTAVVLLIGITDVADGYLARKYQCTTKTGAKLDSVADFVFFTVIVIILVVHYRPIVYGIRFLVLAVACIRLLSLVVCYFRFRELAFIHTIGNKLTGGVIYLSILLLPFALPVFVFRVVISIALLTAIEELLIMLTDKELNLNRKSIFLK